MPAPLVIGAVVIAGAAVLGFGTTAVSTKSIASSSVKLMGTALGAYVAYKIVNKVL